MAGRFRIVITKNKFPALAGVLRSRSKQAKADIAASAVKTAKFYESELKRTAPKAPGGTHELQKGLSVTPVMVTSTTWRMVAESKAPFTKFVIEDVHGNNGSGTRIVPKRYAGGGNTGSGPKALTVFYAGHGPGMPFFRTKGVRPHKGNPFQLRASKKALDYLNNEMKILGHTLTSIDLE